MNRTLATLVAAATLLAAASCCCCCDWNPNDWNWDWDGLPTPFFDTPTPAPTPAKGLPRALEGIMPGLVGDRRHGPGKVETRGGPPSSPPGRR